MQLPSLCPESEEYGNIALRPYVCKLVNFHHSHKTQRLQVSHIIPGNNSGIDELSINICPASECYDISVRRADYAQIIVLSFVIVTDILLASGRTVLDYDILERPVNHEHCHLLPLIDH